MKILIYNVHNTVHSM